MPSCKFQEMQNQVCEATTHLHAPLFIRLQAVEDCCGIKNDEGNIAFSPALTLTIPALLAPLIVYLLFFSFFCDKSLNFSDTFLLLLKIVSLKYENPLRNFINITTRTRNLEESFG